MDEVRDKARLILQAKSIDHDLVGDELHVHHGSAEVRIAFRMTGGRSVISVSADLLTGCAFDDPLSALRSVNERNLALPFGKFSIDEARGVLRLDYQLLGDHLDDAELINALVAVAKTADDHDDELQRDIGSGQRASDRRGVEAPTHLA